jgi:hypothetical protein
MSVRPETVFERFDASSDDGQEYKIKGNVTYLVHETHGFDPPKRAFRLAELTLDDGTPVERIKQGEYRVQGSWLILRTDDPSAP